MKLILYLIHFQTLYSVKKKTITYILEFRIRIIIILRTLYTCVSSYQEKHTRLDTSKA